MATLGQLLLPKLDSFFEGAGPIRPATLVSGRIRGGRERGAVRGSRRVAKAGPIFFEGAAHSPRHIGEGPF